MEVWGRRGGVGESRGRLARKRVGFALRAAIQFAALGAAALVLFVTLSPVFAQDVQLAELQPQAPATLIGAEPLDPSTDKAQSTTLTPAVREHVQSRRRGLKLSLLSRICRRTEA